MDDQDPQIDRTRIRLGLALIGVVFAVSVVMVFAVSALPGKALMFAIAVTAFVRAFRLTRSIRQGGPDR